MRVRIPAKIPINTVYMERNLHKRPTYIKNNLIHKSIQIKDTSSGMSIETLNNQFFILHQKNIDRVKGKDSRGEHGTGKVAALGIGKVLRVKTIHNKLLNEFEIHRADCDLEKSLKKVPIRWNAQNKKVNLPNGTTVEILKWRYKRQISIKSIKEFIQRKTLPEKDAYTHIENLIICLVS